MERITNKQIRRAEKRMAATLLSGDSRAIELAREFLARQIALAEADEASNPRERAALILAALRIQ